MSERINGEPVKLVESFDELREGRIVWVKPCPKCGGTHRGVLTNHNTDAALSMDGDEVEPGGVPTVQVLPVPSCVRGMTENACIRRDRFRPGAVFVVVDGMES